MIKALKRKYINLLLSFGIILMMILISLAFSQIHKLNEANKWIIHSHEVLEATDKVLININYAESKMRAYFISGDKTQILNLDTILLAIQEDLSKLKNLTHDSSIQQGYVNELINMLTWRINDINEKIELYKKFGLKKLFQLPHSATAISNQIRDTISKIVLHETGLLKARNDIVKTKYILINTLIFVCGFFSLIFLFIGVWLLNQQINYRTEVENNLKKSEHELYKLAYFDSLTGLANRTMMHNSIDDFIKSKMIDENHMALLFIDLDNFKNINDSLGHEIGDRLLKAYAKRLKRILGDKNIIARLGGDEFIVLLTNVKNKNEVWYIAKSILYSMAAAFNIQTNKIFVTSSIGISLYPAHGNTSHELLKNADIAMYKAKELGKNNIQICAPELTLQAEESALVDYELHRALSNNEFYLLYQPIISLKNNSIVSVETLIRWQRPNMGIVYPESFIPLAENNGLIVPISNWMLTLACLEAKSWLPYTHKKSVKLAVNISTRQLSLPDFVSAIRKILIDTNFDPSLLELEITESVLFENSYTNLSTLNALKDMGIKISIDDFGTGYSSLSYLRLFSIDKLKIDRSFMNEVIPGNYTSRIIKSIINMAHDLNIQVLAEGVETEEQLAFLKEHHCDEVQGYYYSHPLTAQELSIFLKTHHKQPE